MADLTIAVVGCGGIGGFVIDNLVRSGAKKVVLIDSDCYEQGNFNRQIFAQHNSVGMSKCQYIAQQLTGITDDIDIVTHYQRLNNGNCQDLLDGADIVFDCVDNIATKLIIEQYCHRKGIDMIHGAVDGYYAQCCITNDGITVANLYQDYDGCVNGNDYTAVSIVSAVMVSLLYAYLENRAEYNKIISIDLLQLSIDII